MDFVSDQLFDGSRFRALTVVDNYSRKCLAIHPDQSIKGSDVVNIMEKLKLFKGSVPERIQVDNGSEFISKSLDKWAYDNKVTLDFSRPGKPTDNPYIESFNGSFRDECLNVNWFLSYKMPNKKYRPGEGNTMSSGLIVRLIIRHPNRCMSNIKICRFSTNGVSYIR